LREVARGVGFLLHIPAVMALLSMPVAFFAGEHWGLTGLGLTAALALVIGQGLRLLGRGAQTFHRYQSMQIAGISWLLIAILGAIPFFVSALLAPAASSASAAMDVFQAPVFALFESTSGFTSTGLTVVARASELPAHIQWWRSLSEWIGGIGVILLLVAILPAERGALNLYFSEAREEKILPTVKSTVRAIWLIYLGFTLFGIGLLWLAGEPLWRAVNHGMTAIATGGFTITDDSLMSASASVQLAYMPLMLIGAISFLVHYRLLVERPGWRVIGQSTELRLLFWIALGGVLLLWAERWFSIGETGGVATAFVLALGAHHGRFCELGSGALDGWPVIAGAGGGIDGRHGGFNQWWCEAAAGGPAAQGFAGPVAGFSCQSPRARDGALRRRSRVPATDCRARPDCCPISRAFHAALAARCVRHAASAAG